MWIFGRSPKRKPPTAPRDTEYGFFSETEGAQFRALVREAFADEGLEITLRSGAVSDNTGRQFNMRNLATICHNEPRGRERWPYLIRGHVSHLLQVVDGPSPLESLAPDQLLARLRPWVVPRGFIEPNADRYVHARVVAPGLCEVLALDLHNSVLTLPDNYLAPLGDILELRMRALNNLRELPVDCHTILEGPDEIHFDVVTGDSFFTSSRVLAMNELVQDLTGRPLGQDGALVAMPNRHQLALRPIDTVRDTTLIPTLHGMSVFAAANFHDAVGSVSPEVYWWHAGTLTRLVRQNGEEYELTGGIEFEMLQWRLASNAADERF